MNSQELINVFTFLTISLAIVTGAPPTKYEAAYTKAGNIA